ncbi:MAG: S41 family peptidase [Candidatus Sulfomarinibacteraceae bacterium]
MKRFRIALLVTSVSVVLLFAGLLTAGLDSKESLFQALGNLAEVVHLVESEYVDELDADVLALSLDAGILESIDPWAAVVSDDQVEAYERVFANPPAYGLGLSLRLGSAAVRFVFPGSPASDAGLESWEVIEKIDGVYTRGRPLWQIALELADRESRGEIVILTVMDRQVDQRRDVELVPRDWVPVHATLETLDELRVLTVESLTGGSAAAIAELIAADPPDIVDLRGVVWGLESQAVQVADLFIAEGTIAAWKGREAGSAVIEATGDSGLGVPLVLISSETEGVGEVLASAFKRSGAELLGQPTLGHAPHMQIVRRGDLNLWIPVGRWLGPDDEPIRGAGLEPDEEIPAPDDDEEGDPVLDRAIEKLTSVELPEAA